MTRKRKRTPIGAVFWACPLYGHLLLAALLLMPALALAKIAIFYTDSPYQNNQKITKTLSIPGAAAVLVSVSGSTQTGHDFVEILDSAGNPLNPAKQFTGTIDELFAVNGETIQVHFTSDGWRTGSGVTVAINVLMTLKLKEPIC